MDLKSLTHKLHYASHKSNKPSNCACAEMEKHFMEMATSAYKSVRQCDDTMHSFKRDTNKSSNKRFYGAPTERQKVVYSLKDQTLAMIYIDACVWQFQK